MPRSRTRRGATTTPRRISRPDASWHLLSDEHDGAPALVAARGGRASGSRRRSTFKPEARDRDRPQLIRETACEFAARARRARARRARVERRRTAHLRALGFTPSTITARARDSARALERRGPTFGAVHVQTDDADAVDAPCKGLPRPAEPEVGHRRRLDPVPTSSSTGSELRKSRQGALVTRRRRGARDRRRGRARSSAMCSSTAASMVDEYASVPEYFGRSRRATRSRSAPIPLSLPA